MKLTLAACVAAMIVVSPNAGLAYEPNIARSRLDASYLPIAEFSRLTRSSPTPDWATGIEIETSMVLDHRWCSSGRLTHGKVMSLSLDRSQARWMAGDDVYISNIDLWTDHNDAFVLLVGATPRFGGLGHKPIAYRYVLLDRFSTPLCATSSSGDAYAAPRLKVRLLLDAYNGLLNVSKEGAPLQTTLNSPFYFGAGPTMMREILHGTNYRITAGDSLSYQYSALNAVAWNRLNGPISGRSVVEDMRLAYDASSSPLRQPLLDFGQGAAGVLAATVQ